MKVILVMALAVDGKIARDSHHPVNWTGQEDKKWFVRLTKNAGVVIMGSKTFDMIGKVLPDRKNIVMTRNKKRKSITEHLVFTDKNPDILLKDLEHEGFTTVAVIGGTIINSLFVKHNLIDEIYLTVIPRLFGKGLSLFGTEMEIRLELLEYNIIETDVILLRYAVMK